MVFARDGYERATIRSIAAEAGIHASMVMRYHGTKQDLFAAAAALDLKLPELGEMKRGSLGRGAGLPLPVEVGRRDAGWATASPSQGLRQQRGGPGAADLYLRGSACCRHLEHRGARPRAHPRVANRLADAGLGLRKIRGEGYREPSIWKRRSSSSASAGPCRTTSRCRCRCRCRLLALRRSN